MATYGPEDFTLKNDSKITFRHCIPEEAHLFPAFQKQVARETSFTLQTDANTPTIENSQEAWKQSLQDPLSLRLNALSEGKIIAQFSFRPASTNHPWTAHIGNFGMMVLKSYWGQGVARRMLEIIDSHAIGNGFTRIEAMVRVKNERGVRLYK